MILIYKYKINISLSNVNFNQKQGMLKMLKLWLASLKLEKTKKYSQI